MKDKKVKIFKLIMLGLVIGIMIFLTVKFIPIFKSIATEEGRVTFKEEIEGLGAKGIFAIVGLMIAQIFLPILPRRACRNTCRNVIWSYSEECVLYLYGAFLSSLIIFFAVRKFGRSFIYSFISKEKIEKLEKSKLFSDPKRIDTILFILFFIPGTPKDLFVYLAGLLPIKPVRFLTLSTFARFPSIISSTIAGSSLVNGNWTLIVITYGVTFLLVGVIAYVFNKKEKVNIKLH